MGSKGAWMVLTPVDHICPAACLRRPSWSSWPTCGTSSVLYSESALVQLEKGISTVVFPGSLSMFGNREAGCEYSPETGGSAEAGSNHAVMGDSLARFESDTARASHWPASLCSLAGSEQ